MAISIGGKVSIGADDIYLNETGDAAKILSELKTVDGTGSGLDADLVDGLESQAVRDLAPTGDAGFLAHLSATASNVTGDGTAFTVAADTEIFDKGSDYNSSNGVFTAPGAGHYIFNIVVQISGLNDANHDDFFIDLVTSNNTYRLLTLVADSLDIGGAIIVNGSAIADMDASDTARFNIQVNGSAKTVDVGGAATNQSSISGYFLGT